MFDYRFGSQIVRLPIFYLWGQLRNWVTSICLLRVLLCFYSAIAHSVEFCFRVVTVRLNGLVHICAIFHMDISPREWDKVFNLLLNTKERLSFRDVIDSYASIRVPDVTIWNRSKPFLPGGIPQLQFYHLFVVNLYIFHFEIYSDRAILRGCKGPFAKSNQKWSLACIGVPDHNDFIKRCYLPSLYFFRLKPDPRPYTTLALFPCVYQVSIPLIILRVFWAIDLFEFLKLIIILHIHGGVQGLRIRSSFSLVRHVDLHRQVIDFIICVKPWILSFHIFCCL